MTPSAFAANAGIDPQRLWRWRRRLGGPSGVVVFEEIVRATASASLLTVPVLDTEASRFEILLRSGRVVRVPAGFDAGALGRLLAVVDREGMC
jgi:hypothetical protein